MKGVTGVVVNARVIVDSRMDYEIGAQREVSYGGTRSIAV